MIDTCTGLNEHTENYAKWKQSVSKGFFHTYINVSFHFYYILETAKLRSRGQILAVRVWERRGVGGKLVYLQKGNMSNPRGDTVLYLDSISINILLVILYCNFVRCYHWGKLGKRDTRSLCIISYNCMWISSYLKKKKVKFKK